MIDHGEQFWRQTERASTVNRENLAKLLRDNRDTDFGRRYDFASIDGADTYRNSVPLSSYDHFEGYIKRMLAGENNVLTVYPAISYCRSSGSMGAPKLIPVSAESEERYGNLFMRHVDECLEREGGRRLLVSTFRSDLDRSFERSLVASEIYFRYGFERGWFREERYIGGRLLNFARHPGDSFYAKGWAALLAEDLRYVESIYLYEQIPFFSFLEKNWERLLWDMEREDIPADVDLSGEVRSFLLHLPRSRERLSLLRRVCGEGFDDIFHRLWPGARMVCGISSQAFFAEEAALERYVGGADKYFVWYGASECWMGIAQDENTYRYILHPDTAFFEFIPYEENTPETAFQETLLPEELTAGRYYEVVVTNFSGLYRYRMGDVVRLVDRCGEAPVVEFQFRKSQAVNLAGEKTSISQIEAVMRKLAEEGIEAEDYCFGASVEAAPGSYVAILCIESADRILPGGLAERIDRLLAEQNCDYDDLRRLGYIDKPFVFVYNLEEFQSFIAKHLLSDGQKKPRHIAPSWFKVGDIRRRSSDA